MSNLHIRPITQDDHPAVAQLIVASTNHWYQEHIGHDIFTCPPDDAQLFCAVYAALDPGQGILIEDTDTGAIAGSCFIHPRPTHVSLGIMNASPDYAGTGVARRLLRHATDLADAQGLPMRLVSSAMNLDSFSLYNRAGFKPTAVVQDMLFDVPEQGVSLPDDSPAHRVHVRPATQEDVEAIAALEYHIAGIRRPNDWRYFIDNTLNIWTTSVAQDQNGALTGVLSSIAHPASSMVGPGLMTNDVTARALLAYTLNQHPGKTLVALIPADRPPLAAQCYAWGARNCELHLVQVRGTAPNTQGIIMPTFMPETG